MNFYTTETVNKEVRILAKSHLDKSSKYPNMEAFNIATDISVEKSLPTGINNPLSLMQRFDVKKSMSFKETYEAIVQKLNQSIF